MNRPLQTASDFLAAVPPGRVEVRPESAFPIGKFADRAPVPPGRVEVRPESECGPGWVQVLRKALRLDTKQALSDIEKADKT